MLQMSVGQLWCFMSLAGFILGGLGVIIGLGLGHSLMDGGTYRAPQFSITLCALFISVFCLMVLWVFAVMGGWLDGNTELQTSTVLTLLGM